MLGIRCRPTLYFVVATLLSHDLVGKSVEAHQVCYAPFGCFSAESPYNRWFGLPVSPRRLQTRLTVQTSLHSHSCSLSIVDGFGPRDLNSTCFQPNVKTTVIVHGAFESSSKPWVGQLARGLLANNATESNVVIVDWSRGASSVFRLGGNARLVAMQLAYFLRRLMEFAVLEPLEVHVIGFSAGAHIAGQAGDELRSRGMTLGRITGLDPPKPVYLLLDIPSRPEDPVYRRMGLDTSDAIFVDIIHTDTDFIGIKNPIGHLDFYPNGGSSQPSCKRISFTKGLSKLVACDHMTAPQYFLATVMTPCRYPAIPCPPRHRVRIGHDCHVRVEGVVMGMQADRTSHVESTPSALFVDTTKGGAVTC